MNATERSSSKPLISLETYELWVEILHVPTLALSFIGIVNNVINIRVFLRHGITSDSTTVSLLALSVSDFLACVFIFPQAVCFYFDAHSNIENPLIKNCFVLSTMASTYPHIICTKITSWITVYISVERAACVLWPLKVKALFRSRNTAIIMILIALAFVVAHIPYATTTLIIWLPDPYRNSTYKAVNSHTSDLGTLFFNLNNLVINSILTSVAMVTVAVATVAMMTRLYRSSKWRSAFASLKHGKDFKDKAGLNMTPREMEVLKMMSAITTVFLSCQAVSHIPSLVMTTVPGVAVDGYNRYIFNLIYSVRFVFEILNSSLHFFFYIKMSTRYRKTFDEIFLRKRNVKKSSH